MKVFVTGVGGQLGHDVMCELFSRGIECVGTDITEKYSGIAGTPVETLPYMSLDITDSAAVERVIFELRPDAVITVPLGLPLMPLRLKKTAKKLWR